MRTFNFLRLPAWSNCIATQITALKIYSGQRGKVNACTGDCRPQTNLNRADTAAGSFSGKPLGRREASFLHKTARSCACCFPRLKRLARNTIPAVLPFRESSVPQGFQRTWSIV